jgi:tetratricopeptide (TPR) repeat protein
MHRKLFVFSTVGLALFATVAFALDRDQNMVRCERGNADIAIGGCTELIQSGWETDRNLAVSFFHRGRAYFRMQDYDRAVQDFDDAIRLYPSFLNAFFQRGDVYLVKQDYDRAVRDFDEVIRLDPSDAIAFRYRGDVYLAKEDYDRAIQDYDEVLRLDPSDTAAVEARARASTGP